jgi:membrane-bound lytic murein transglycosylase D
VLKYVRYFTESREGRKFVVETLRRSGRFQEVIAKALRERGLPQELVAVVFIESSFSPAAVSTAGAAGLWQFMPHTARAYGLAVESTYDERASLWRSTEAAAHHLADLYERFRSWDNALAAYNLGYDGLERRLDENDTDDFWTLADSPGALPAETAAYVPKVLAIAVVLANLDEFGFGDVERAQALDASELAVPPGTSLAVVARAAGTSLRALRDLNPELLADTVPNRGAEVTLHVPRGGLARARVMLSKLIADGKDAAEVSADFDWGRDDVHDGRSRLERTRATRNADGGGTKPVARLGFSLHRRTRTSRTDDMIARAKKYISDRAAEVRAQDEGEAAPPAIEPEASAAPEIEAKPAARGPRASAEGSRVSYRVQPGDSVKAIAAAHGLTVDQLLAQAGVSSPDQIAPGTVLELRAIAPAGSGARGPKGHRSADRD